jgi:hypothetical protein
VSIPALAPRMKQLDNLATDAPRQVGAFAQVATLATPSQVRQIALASVFSRDDMFDVKGERLIVLVNPAILAPKTGSCAHTPPNRGIH